MLRRWEYDVRELQVADEEGMTAPKPQAVHQAADIVLDALRKLGAPADVNIPRLPSRAAADSVLNS